MVTCNRCSKQIIDPKDVNVTAFWGIKPVVWCNNCYSARERGFWRHVFYGHQKAPLNSTYYLLGLITSTVVFILLAVVFLTAPSNQQVVYMNQATTTGEVPLLVKLLFLLIIGALILWGLVLRFIARSIVRKAGAR